MDISATAPLFHEDIRAAVKRAGTAASHDDQDFQNLIDQVKILNPELREHILGHVQSPPQQMAFIQGEMHLHPDSAAQTPGFAQGNSARLQAKTRYLSAVAHLLGTALPQTRALTLAGDARTYVRPLDRLTARNAMLHDLDSDSRTSAQSALSLLTYCDDPILLQRAAAKFGAALQGANQEGRFKLLHQLIVGDAPSFEQQSATQQRLLPKDETPGDRKRLELFTAYLALINDPQRKGELFRQLEFARNAFAPESTFRRNSKTALDDFNPAEITAAGNLEFFHRIREASALAETTEQNLSTTIGRFIDSLENRELHTLPVAERNTIALRLSECLLRSNDLPFTQEHARALWPHITKALLKGKFDEEISDQLMISFLKHCSRNEFDIGVAAEIIPKALCSLNDHMQRENPRFCHIKSLSEFIQARTIRRGQKNTLHNIALEFVRRNDIPPDIQESTIGMLMRTWKIEKGSSPYDGEITDLLLQAITHSDATPTLYSTLFQNLSRDHFRPLHNGVDSEVKNIAFAMLRSPHASNGHTWGIVSHLLSSGSLNSQAYTSLTVKDLDELMTHIERLPTGEMLVDIAQSLLRLDPERRQSITFATRALKVFMKHVQSEYVGIADRSSWLEKIPQFAVAHGLDATIIAEDWTALAKQTLQRKVSTNTLAKKSEVALGIATMLQNGWIEREDEQIALLDSVHAIFQLNPRKQTGYLLNLSQATEKLSDLESHNNIPSPRRNMVCAMRSDIIRRLTDSVQNSRNNRSIYRKSIERLQADQPAEAS